MINPLSPQAAQHREAKSEDDLRHLCRAAAEALGKNEQMTVLKAKEFGEYLCDLSAILKPRHGEWTKFLQGLSVSQRKATNCMRIFASWDKLNHPSSVNEALRILTEQQAEEVKPITDGLKELPGRNPPLCGPCQHRVNLQRPVPKGCEDCKAVREQWRAAQEAARNAEEPEDEDDEPEEEPGPTYKEPHTKKHKFGRNPPAGAELFNLDGFTAAIGNVMKQIDALAHEIGLGEKQRSTFGKPIMTPEKAGFERQLAEVKERVGKIKKAVDEWARKEKGSAK